MPSYPHGANMTSGATKVTPVDDEDSESETPTSRRPSKMRQKSRSKTVLKGLKDLDESVPPTDSVRAKFRICCESPMSSMGAKIFHTLFGGVIMLSLVFMAGESLNHNGYIFKGNMKPHEYKTMEIVFTVLFALDLGFRCAVADRYCVKRRFPDHIEPHLPFLRDLLNLFDLLSILPLPIDYIVGEVYAGIPKPKFIRLLSVFRVLRIFKVTRHFEGTKIIVTTMSRSFKPILVSCFMLISFMMVVSPILFLVEPCLDRDECVFKDGFNAMYYLMITLTTVGYGDQVSRATDSTCPVLEGPVLFFKFFLFARSSHTPELTLLRPAYTELI